MRLDNIQRKIQSIRFAARDARPVAGLSHCFYRYPARFSPAFARTVIREFSKPGDIVLDPYMGGGTTVVEALASGRRAVGSDLNELAVFIARVKTTPLLSAERRAVSDWAAHTVPQLSYRRPPLELETCDVVRTRNMHLPVARPAKKLLGLAVQTIEQLPTPNAQRFVRCALLRVGQWALDGRKAAASAGEIRCRMQLAIAGMLSGLLDFESAIAGAALEGRKRWLRTCDASKLYDIAPFSDASTRADLVVTSPPYPGIHVLYHRWQVDGRRETPAPYWISGCQDGEGASFYNFADRRPAAIDAYFAKSLETLTAIRSVVRDGAMFVQLLAFAQPQRHLGKYLRNMQLAGFREVRVGGSSKRIWRSVPNRRWHATMKGQINASKEVVLVHEAV